MGEYTQLLPHAEGSRTLWHKDAKHDKHVSMREQSVSTGNLLHSIKSTQYTLKFVTNSVIDSLYLCFCVSVCDSVSQLISLLLSTWTDALPSLVVFGDG